MELTISIILGFMIIGALYALHAKDLLSAVVAMGIVGYGLVICFLLLKAPDLAIVQIVVETITLVIMVAVVLDSTREEIQIGLDRRSILQLIDLDENRKASSNSNHRQTNLEYKVCFYDFYLFVCQQLVSFCNILQADSRGDFSLPFWLKVVLENNVA